MAAPFVTLVEDPTDARSWGASPVDAEGLATRRVPLIEAGVLRGFVHSTWTARRMGTHSTGSAVRAGFKSTPTAGCRAVALTPGDRAAAALLADVGDGVLVQEVSGLHSGVNPISGRLLDRSRGPAHPGRRAGRAAARVHHRLHDPAPAARRGGGRLRSHVAADERRRHDARRGRRRRLGRLSGASNRASCSTSRPRSPAPPAPGSRSRRSWAGRPRRR